MMSLWGWKYQGQNDDVVYWHEFIDGGTEGCAAVLAGGIRCHAWRDQHDTAKEPELPDGVDREATRE